MIKNHPGYFGAFTTAEASGAYPNGTRIQKVFTEEGDSTPLGVEGTVLGSIDSGELGIAYFVEWDNKPNIAVTVMAKKIGVAE